MIFMLNIGSHLSFDLWMTLIETLSNFNVISVQKLVENVVLHYILGILWVLCGKLQGLTTLNKPKSREVSTNDGIITQNIFNAAVPTSIETK